MRSLSLHHMTAADLPVEALIDQAADHGCDAVSIFTHLPAAMPIAIATVADDPAVASVAARMAARGVSLLNAEYFPLGDDVDPAVYRAGLERGARLGATRATTHVRIADPDTRIDRFGAMCDLCAEYGLSLALEFTPSSAIETLDAAVELVASVGRRNASITLDMLHAGRTGLTPADLARVAPERIGAIQLCDGPAHMPADRRRHESLNDRLPPGEGELPVIAMLRALPAHVPVELEVPQHRLRDAGVAPAARIARAVNAARAILAEAEAVRPGDAIAARG